MHINVLQGTQSGFAPPRELHLTTVQNQQSFGNIRLDYVSLNVLHLTRVTNANTINNVVLNHVTVSFLNQTAVNNVNTISNVELVALPFVPNNPETTTLLACCTFAYSTTQKIQIDTMISGLKDAGVWTKLDWFSCFRLMGNEHDSLLNWKDCTKTLVKVGSPTYEDFVGWTGTLAFSAGRLKSNWNLGDGASSGTDFCAFAKVESVVASENGMVVLGIWQLSQPGPSSPEGLFLVENPLDNSGFSGTWALPFDGMTGYVAANTATPTQHAVTRSGSTQKYFRNGSQIATRASIGIPDPQTHADGIALLGSSKTARSFNGLQSYGGWGKALTGTELSNIESAFQTAKAPPEINIPTSYSNPGGTGNRTSIITVTTTASIHAPASPSGMQGLVDGSGNNGNSPFFEPSGQSGVSITFQFTAAKAIKEAKWYQNVSSAQGTWKWQGSNDGSSFTDISSTFTLDGTSTGNVIGDLSANNHRYVYYRMQMTAGTVNDTPFLREIEFSIST